MPSLPFHIASPDAPLLLLPATVNDHGPVDFILDTGNGAPVDLFISPSTLDHLGLPPDHPLSTTIVVKAIQLGDLRLQNVRAAVLPAMDQIGTKLGVPIAGNIGYHFLRNWRIEIDYIRNTIRLDQPDAREPPRGVPFTTGPGGAFILLPTAVNNHGLFRFLVDTGASSTVISPKLARRLRITGHPVEAIGVQGGRNAKMATLDSLEAAGQRVEVIAAAIVDVFAYTSQAAGATVNGILGYSFLSQFRVLIDYPRKHIALEHPQAQNPRNHTMR
jgi:predicted aspartyl protease